MYSLELVSSEWKFICNELVVTRWTSLYSAFHFKSFEFQSRGTSGTRLFQKNKIIDTVVDKSWNIERKETNKREIFTRNWNLQSEFRRGFEISSEWGNFIEFSLRLGCHLLPDPLDPESIAQFLRSYGINKTSVGEYIGKNKDFNKMTLDVTTYLFF